MTVPPDVVAAVFKAYDIRGVVPDQITDELAWRVGAAFVEVLRSEADVPGVVIGYDMRPSSPALSAAFADGVCSQGVDVTVIGLASTDELYCASGLLNQPGAMFTASHNPAQYNGIKLCRALAAPVGVESGLAQIASLVADPTALNNRDQPPGRVIEHDMLAAYAAHLHSLVPLAGIRPLTVVIDAGNGMAGHTVPTVLSPSFAPLTVVPMYFELDGTFPNHEANPIEPANLRDLQRAVVEHHADVGLAFDGDADRCFVVDEQGTIVSPSVLTALIAARELKRVPGATIIHSLITSRTVAEVIEESGGHPVRTKVGHSFIKQRMAETGAVFGGEHSGHFYFADFWRADSGMLAAMHVLAELGAQSGPLSHLLAGFNRYTASGEINSVVADQAAATSRIRGSFATRDGVSVDELDGLTISADAWWFNVRPSNTEPLLRLNVEAIDEPTMSAIRDEVLNLMKATS